MLWEENVRNNGQAKTVIRYRIARDGMDAETKTMTSGEFNAFVPVVTHTKDGFLTAYLMEKNNHVGVYLTKF